MPLQLSSGPETESLLENLVRTFPRDAVQNRQLIRDLLDADPATFLANSIEILKTDRESRGVQYLMSLLVSQHLLFDAMCDSRFDRQQAVDLARLALRVDSMVDVDLARRLADVAVSDPNASGLGNVGRLLEILGDLSDGTRILPSLMRLLRNANPYLRSKAVLMIGRGSRSVKWVKGRLAEADARVRANAVEALWGVDSAEARELLQFTAHDGNNRVAGNALLGLYWLGDCAAIRDLIGMAGHASGGFRMSAAWAMGESGDSRFTDALGRMLADPVPGVRKRAFTAMSRIKAAVALVTQGEQWLLSASLIRKERPKSPRRISLAVVCNNNREHLSILPTQFLVTEDTTPVLSYKVLERALPEAMSLVLVFPRVTEKGTPWTAAALRCLAWKRPTDLWCILPYLTDGDEDPDEESTLEAPAYTAQPSVLSSALTTAARRAECAGLWKALWNLVRSGSASPRGKRHVVIYAPPGVERRPGHGLIANMISSRTSVQVISAERNEALEDFCRQTGGSFHLADTAEKVDDLISRAYANLLARYEIIYPPISETGATIKIRIHATGGWGETTLAVPAQ